MLDFKRFQQLISKADIDEDVVQKERLLRDAVDLYKGPFCEDIHDDWCLVERERMERLYLKALGQLMHCTMQRKNYDEAIDLGHRILLTDPLREEVHRALMVCYLRLGYHAQALEQYRSYSELLAEELDTIPLPETVKLYDQIVNDRIFSQKPDVEFKDKRFQAELRETIQQHQAVSERLYELLESQNKAAE